MIGGQLHLFFSARSRAFHWAFATLQLLLITVIDYKTGPALALSAFYLLPIIHAGWFQGRKEGYAVALMASAAWLLDDILTNIGYSHPLIPYWNAAATLVFYLTVVTLLGGVRTAFDREHRHARTDHLTQVCNKRSFEEFAALEIARAARYKRPFSLAYFDADNFKEVNDTLGHEAGDELLCQVGRTIHGMIRSADVAARMGGDEFAILLPEMDAADAEALLARIHERLAELMRKNDWPVTFSFGLVTFQSPPESVEELVRLGDALMYEAKRSGKNRIARQIYGGSDPALLAQPSAAPDARAALPSAQSRALD